MKKSIAALIITSICLMFAAHLIGSSASSVSKVAKSKEQRATKLAAMMGE